MADTTIKKVSAEASPVGTLGQQYLVSGVAVSMRLWNRRTAECTTESVRDYETVGYVLTGRARLEIEGQTIDLAPGDSWLVPKGTRHRYEIQGPFSAVEATAPPAHVHGRDEP